MTQLKKSIAAFVVGAGFAANALAADTPMSGSEVETKVDSLLSQMSTEQKIKITRGDGGTYMIPALTALGLDGAVSFDSAMAIRLDGTTVYGTQFPSPMALAATWSINRSKQYGLAIGYETREAGGEFLLAPSINMFRTPYNGRSSEYMTGEDPFLGAVLAPAVVNGVQRQNVGAVGKHFVANEQEANRHKLDETIDARTLRELYLPGFESMVKNSSVAGIMCSFNQVNGHYGCENRHLLTDVLKNQWGFKGFVVSDYDAITNAKLAARAGTDIDNPNGSYFTNKKILALMESGDVTEQMLNSKARRNLRAYVSFGFDTTLNDAHDTLENTEYGTKAALDVARESAVLLRNQRKANGKRILPLSKDAKIAVIGSIANRAPGSPFGTAYSTPTSYVTELSGLKQLATTPSDVDYIEEMELDPATSVWYQAGTSKITNSGLKAEYFSNSTLSGTAALTQVEPGVNFNWTSATNTTSASTTDLSSLDTSVGSFSLRLTGKIKPTISGAHVFKVRSDGAVKLWVNGELVLETDGTPLASDLKDIVAKSAKVNGLVAGKGYSVKLEYRRLNTFTARLGSFQGLQMSWASLTPPSDLSDYDAVVVSAGSTGFEYEGEGFDHDYAMPEYQANMITKVVNANPRTIVVLHGGGSMSMLPWYDKVKATLDTWFPGQQAGQALAEILYGEVNPSGKLPITIDKEISDNPSYASYPDIDAYVGDSAGTTMSYSEGQYIGYRGYDKDGTTPLYPFGYGLSYTTFEFSDLSLNTNVATASSTIKASFTLSNTGDTAGYEVAQLYVEPVDPTTERPVKELKGFSKVWLEPGQSKTVTIPINARALSYWREKDQTWVVDPGKYQILVGDSSASLPLSATVSALVQMTLSPKTSNPLPQPIKEAVQVAASRAY